MCSNADMSCVRLVNWIPVSVNIVWILLRYGRTEIAQELSGHHLARPLMQFDTSELRNAVDGYEKSNLAFASAHPWNIDIEVSDRGSLEPLLWFVAFNLRQMA